MCPSSAYRDMFFNVVSSVALFLFMCQFLEEAQGVSIGLKANEEVSLDYPLRPADGIQFEAPLRSIDVRDFHERMKGPDSNKPNVIKRWFVWVWETFVEEPFNFSTFSFRKSAARAF